ncbi:MAG TPA: hypothetical protein VI588_02990 [Candidatus Gracilibacteria bacterium]|nr:hypothetical protein [Candidatus Gracilibacteria bacterium]
MDALTFLYWALAFGFLALVLFFCVALVHLIRILRDMADASDSVKRTAATVNENVTRIADKVAETTEQVLEYMVKPVSVAQFVVGKIRPLVDMVKTSAEGMRHAMDEEEDKPKKKRGFRRKKK